MWRHQSLIKVIWWNCPIQTKETCFCSRVMRALNQQHGYISSARNMMTKRFLSLSYHYKPDVVEEKMKSSLWFMPTMSVLNFKIRQGYLFQRSAVVLKDVLMYSTVPYIRANLYNFTVLYHENFAVRMQYCTYGNWTMVHFSEGLHILFINALYITHWVYSSTIQYCTLESFDVHCSRVVWFPTSVCSFTVSWNLCS